MFNGEGGGAARRGRAGSGGGGRGRGGSGRGGSGRGGSGRGGSGRGGSGRGGSGRGGGGGSGRGGGGSGRGGGGSGRGGGGSGRGGGRGSGRRNFKGNHQNSENYNQGSSNLNRQEGRGGSPLNISHSERGDEVPGSLAGQGCSWQTGGPDRAVEPGESYPAGDDNDARRGQTRQREGEGNKRQPGFSFNRLKNFLKETNDNVILHIHQDINEWEPFLESEKAANEMLVVLMHVIGEKVCVDSMLSEHQVKILSLCCSSNQFVCKLRGLADQIDGGIFPNWRYSRNPSVVVDCSPLLLLTNMYRFCSFVLRTMPAAAVDYLKGLIASCFLASQNDMIASDELVGQFKQLRSKIEEITKAKKLKDESLQQQQQRKRQFLFSHGQDDSHLYDDQQPPPNSIKDIDVIPSIQELLDPSDPFLRRNKKHGAYQDSDHYLDVQFRLFREDFVRPLRQGIRDFLDNKMEYLERSRMPVGELRLYTNVTLMKVVKERDFIVHKIQLAKHNYMKGNKSIPWDKSKRLLPGALIILTDPNKCFDPAVTHFGVVFNRNTPELEKGILTVTWEGVSPICEDDTQEFLLFESEVYLESRRYTLEILKELQLDRFPMKKFIVDANPTMNAPKYMLNGGGILEVKLKNDSILSIDPLYRPQWPSAASFGLDSNQFKAFRAALTKEFTIIQGPPGTGKTFLGLKVAEVLLTNQQLWRYQPNPITVVCYTNHALDQFLEGILSIYEKNQIPVDIARIGGNSKCESMAEFTLPKVRDRKRMVRPRNYPHEERAAMSKVKECENLRAAKLAELAGLKDLEGIFDFASLPETYQQVYEKYPVQSLWSHLGNQHWYGLSSVQSMEHVNAIIRQWFHVLDAPKCPPAVKMEPAAVLGTKLSRNLNSSNDDDEEEEEEDMDELMETRVQDYHSSGTRNSNQVADYDYHRGQFRKMYVQGCSVGGIADEIKEKAHALEKVKKNNQKLYAREKPQTELAIRGLKIKRNFIEQVFRLYKNKLLALPNVTTLLQDIKKCQIDMDKIHVGTRWALYFAMVDEFRQSIVTNVGKIEKDLITARKAHRAIMDWGDSFILQDCQVVGLTTTGAAKYNNLLKGMRSKIVIVEEAAQVFEAQVVTCITEACQQLIMIGDHLQLRPSPTVYELGTQYNLDLSLFERMVNNQLHCYQLKMQHRMRPDISNLIVGPIYKELLNDAKVHAYPSVDGLAKNLYFLAHNQPESSENESKSKFNKYEQMFICNFARHLTLQGYKPHQITVLTMYTGQMFNLRSALRKLPSCQGVRVTNVDNFQGEENDIIILSLVRSNAKGNIGFLKIDNRVNVALSRAKHGLYIFGNMDCMVKQSKTWQAIRTKLEASKNIGPQLELKCRVHDIITPVRTPNDFPPEGGCFGKCRAVLPCSHVCQLACHIIDHEPEKHKCEEKCLKVCTAGLHPCTGRCYKNPCPRCNVKVEKTLNCELRHKKMFPCHQNVDEEICHTPVKKLLPCQHEETLACFVSIYDYKCLIPVEKELPCKHKKKLMCFVDPKGNTCKQMVEGILPGCRHSQRAECWRWKRPTEISCDTIVKKPFLLCDHKVDVKCCDNDKPIKCKEKCTTRLDCGHPCTQKCHGDQDPKHITYKCSKRCRRKCKNDHPCKLNHPCCKPESCPPCTEIIQVTLPCGHLKQLMCFEYTNGLYKCEEPCKKSLPGIRCGHKCPNLCYQECGPCKELVKKRASCSHGQYVLCDENPTKDNCTEKVVPKNKPICGHWPIKVPCKYDTLSPEKLVNYCNAPCDLTFATAAATGCAHKCGGTCNKCRQGRLHLKCREKCGRSLVCGHRCDVPCSAACPPCQKPCQVRCEHSKCTKKCGEPCAECKEECTWRCPHARCTKLCGEMCNRKPCNIPCPKKLQKCGHDCVGFCGEPCPPLCRTCNKDALEETCFWSGEEVEDARFVLLEDCPTGGGHTIEVTALERFLLVSPTGDDHGIGDRPVEISMKCCPLCKTPIINCRRFGNLIRGNYRNVIGVKTKLLGNLGESDKLRDSWISKLRTGSATEIPNVFNAIHKRLCDFLFEEISTGSQFKSHLLRKTIDEASMKSLDFTAKCIDKVSNEIHDICTTKKLEEPQLRAVLVEYVKLFLMMLDRQPLTRQEIIDFNGELDRLDYYKQLMVRRCLPQCQPQYKKIYSIYTLAKEIVTSSMPFTSKRKDVFKKRLQELDQLMKTGLGITERERQEILQAFDMLPGHWFKCPNGHIYAIGECGGAMERAQCPEPGCGAAIGGSNHQVVQGNLLASEMDGATRPAYPSALQRY